MEDRTLTITTDNGEEILCEILFTTHLKEFNKDYVVFVEKGTDNASAAVFIPHEDGKGELIGIESEEEWALLEEALDEFNQRQEKEENCEDDCSTCSKSCDSRDLDIDIEE